MKKKFDIDNIKLTPYEKRIEEELLRGEWITPGPEEQARMRKIVKAHQEHMKKNTVLNMRINGGVLKKLKQKAKKIGLKYQTYISHILRQVAES